MSIEAQQNLELARKMMELQGKLSDAEARVAELEAELSQLTGLPSPDYATARSDAEGER